MKLIFFIMYIGAEINSGILEISTIESDWSTITLKLERIKRLFTDTNQLREKLVARAEDYTSFFISLLGYYSSENGKIRCGEKTPQHARHVQTLCQMYPQSLIIHIVRDPRAVVNRLSVCPGPQETWLRIL